MLRETHSSVLKLFFWGDSARHCADKFEQKR
jgi:hypothetical protein